MLLRPCRLQLCAKELFAAVFATGAGVGGIGQLSLQRGGGQVRIRAFLGYPLVKLTASSW